MIHDFHHLEAKAQGPGRRLRRWAQRIAKMAACGPKEPKGFHSCLLRLCPYHGPMNPSVLPRLAHSCFLTKEPGPAVPPGLRPKPLLKAFPSLAALERRPLPIDPGRWTPLGALSLAAGEGLVPSLQGSKPWTGRATLRFESSEGQLTLLPITFGGEGPAPKSEEAPDPSLPSLTQGLDGVIAKASQDLTVSLRLEGDPGALLLSFARRSWEQGVEAEDPGESATLPSFPHRSQIAEGGDTARHRCSPTSLRMVLEGFGQAVSERFYEACRHDAFDRFFGLWPQNLAALQGYSVTGVLQLFSSLAQAKALLDAGFALVPSVRFAAGTLPEAPLSETQGHLLVLRGFRAGAAEVLDPAAPNPETVARRYPIEAFAKAWLAHRGAAYVLWPRAWGGDAS